MGSQARDRQAALRAARSGRARPLAPGHRRQPRCLHPVHALPARLPRRAGQRRDRPGVPRRTRQDRLRHRRRHGRLHLRGLRRMRAGLPHRRAHAGARRGAGRARQAGGVGMPILRRRLPAHLQRQGRQDPVRRRPGRPGQPRAALRQGPLRLRLRAPSATPHEAADPACRCAQERRLHDGPRARDGRVPRSDAGRKRWTSPAAAWPAFATNTARSRWPVSVRPRAATKRPICSRSWCAPASAATTSTTARASVMPRRWWRCSKASVRAPSRTR